MWAPQNGRERLEQQTHENLKFCLDFWVVFVAVVVDFEIESY